MLKEEKTDQEVEGDLKDMVTGIKGRMGVKEGEVIIYDGGESQIAGYTEKGSKDIGFNVGKNGVDLNNGADIWEKGVHESAHAAGENEKWAGLRGEAAKEAWKRENEYNGNRTGISEVNQASWVTQQKSKGQESAINQGTQRAGKVKEFDGYKWKTGEVEKGDTLTSIVQIVNYNYGTKYDAKTIAKINNIQDPEKIRPGEKVQVGTIDKDGNTWKPPYEEGVVNVDYWDGLTEGQQKITHYHRQVFTDDDLPKTKTELNKNEKRNWNNQGEALAHNIGTKGNEDYRGTGYRANQQAIYDSKGKLVTTPENGGSYDYVIPPGSVIDLLMNDKKLDGHLKIDVNPWLEYGNSPQDMTTNKQRVDSLAKSWKGRIALKRMGYQEDLKTKKWVKK